MVKQLNWGGSGGGGDAPCRCGCGCDCGCICMCELQTTVSDLQGEMIGHDINSGCLTILNGDKPGALHS